MIAVSAPRPCAISAAKNPGCSRGKRAPRFPHPVIGMQIGLRVMAQPARVGVDHRFEKRAALLDRDQLVDLLLVLDDRETHLGVFQDIGHLVGDRVLVDRHRNAAQCLCRRDRPIKPRPVVADDRELVAARETEPLRARRPAPRPRPRPGPSSSSARCRNLSRASPAARAAAGHARAAASERCPRGRESQPPYPKSGARIQAFPERRECSAEYRRLLAAMPEPCRQVKHAAMGFCMAAASSLRSRNAPPLALPTKVTR